MDYDVTYDIDGRAVGDKELFAIMRGAMKVLNFADEDERNIFKIMAIVLHLGNIEFGGKKIKLHRTVGPALLHSHHTIQCHMDNNPL